MTGAREDWWRGRAVMYAVGWGQDRVGRIYVNIRFLNPVRHGTHPFKQRSVDLGGKTN
jgi:hypothetical protein